MPVVRVNAGLVPAAHVDVSQEAPPNSERRSGGVSTGLAVTVAIAAVATAIGHSLPLLGAPVAGILLGVALSGVARRRPVLAPGVRFAARTVLQVAVVVLGAQLSLRQVAQVGMSSLPVMLGTLATCLIAAYLLGRWLGVERDLVTLIGVGTAICGASAIAATSPVIKARSATVAYAVSTIFCFNIAAVLLFPPLGHLLHLSQDAFGLFAGTAVNDTSSVVAAATTYGKEAGDHAVVVKLVRTLMIIPITLVLGALASKRQHTDAREAPARRAVRLVPWFLVGFVLLATANTVGVLPSAVLASGRVTAIFLITVALTAIGLGTDVAALRRAGARPLLLGGLLWIVVATSSLLLQWASS